MADATSDVELMLQVKRGDRDAFNTLVQRYRKPLINFIYRFTSNSTTAEDLAHEAFLKAFRSANRYEPRAEFSTWLYRIATNAALNHMRGQKSHSLLSLDWVDDEGEATVSELKDPKMLIEDRLIEQERVSQIRNALADLPEGQRLALILTKYQGLSLKETAEVLKCSEAAVKSLIFRAYNTLRARLTPAILLRT